MIIARSSPISSCRRTAPAPSRPRRPPSGSRSATRVAQVRAVVPGRAQCHQVRSMLYGPAQSLQAPKPQRRVLPLRPCQGGPSALPAGLRLLPLRRIGLSALPKTMVAVVPLRRTGGPVTAAGVTWLASCRIVDGDPVDPDVLGAGGSGSPPCGQGAAAGTARGGPVAALKHRVPPTTCRPFPC